MVLARAHLAGTAVVPLARDLSDLPAATCPPGAATSPSSRPSSSGRSSGPTLVDALAGLDAVLVGGGAADPTVLERARAAGIAVRHHVRDERDLRRLRLRRRPPRRRRRASSSDGDDDRISIAGPGPVLRLPRASRPDRRGARSTAGSARPTGAAGDRPDGTPRLRGPRPDRRRRRQRRPTTSTSPPSRPGRRPGRSAARPRSSSSACRTRSGASRSSPSPTPPPALDGLRAWVRAELPAYAAPRRLVVLDRAAAHRQRQGRPPPAARGPGRPDRAPR